MEKLVRKKVHRKKGSHGVGESRDGLLKINGKEQIFGDESKIMISPDERRMEKSWGRLAGRSCFTKTTLEVMIWGCISWFGPGTVASMDENINANKYQVILKGTSNLWPVVPHFPEGGYSFRDNVMVHRAILIVKYKTRNHILSLFWTALSPNLNIIENLWLLIKFGLI